MARIRVPQQWHGDFLASLGAARIAERRLKELCKKYGKSQVKKFIRNWFDYSENLMRRAIEDLPAAQLHNSGSHDAFPPYLPDGLDLNVDIEIQPATGRIVVDLTDNVPNVDCGLNLTKATTLAGVYSGVFQGLGGHIPKNAGSFRRIEVELKQGAAVGIPEFPYSCSVATTNLYGRLVNCVSAAFAQLGEPYGVAEGPVSMGIPHAVISGTDTRTNQRFVNQMLMGAAGGPASSAADGWLTWNMPSSSGLTYRDSIEIDELKMPIRYRHVRMLADTGGAGRNRGGCTVDMAYEATVDGVSVISASDGQVNAAKGVHGAQSGYLASDWMIDTDGNETRLASGVSLTLSKGQAVRGIECSGGGYGNPLDREPERVLRDILGQWETVAHARSVYGVVVAGTGDAISVDVDATQAARAELRHLLLSAS